MSNRSELEVAISELESVGIKPRQQMTGSGHIKLFWQAAPGKPLRSSVCPSSGSDWRGRHNKRCEIRRMLRQDGAFDVQPPTTLSKALSTPKPIAPVNEQMLNLREELSDMTELLFVVVEHLTDMKRGGGSSAPAEEPKPILKLNTQQKQPSLVERVLEAMALTPASVEQIARASHCSNKNSLGATLSKLKSEGLVLNPQRGLWMKSRQQANGHAAAH